MQHVFKSAIKTWLLYNEDNDNDTSLTLSVLPRETRVMKNKNFHGVVQSNNAVCNLSIM